MSQINEYSDCPPKLSNYFDTKFSYHEWVTQLTWHGDVKKMPFNILCRFSKKVITLFRSITMFRLWNITMEYFSHSD